MVSGNHRPRCSIQIVNVEDAVVPILDEGAVITPATSTTPYREVWTEEEDLAYVYREPIVAPDGTTTIVEHPGDVHGNFGFDFTFTPKTRKAVLRVDYFTVLPVLSGGALRLVYEPKSVTITGRIGRGSSLHLAIDLQAGFSEARGRPDFRLLRVSCK